MSSLKERLPGECTEFTKNNRIGPIVLETIVLVTM